MLLGEVEENSATSIISNVTISALAIPKVTSISTGAATLLSTRYFTRMDFIAFGLPHGVNSLDCNFYRTYTICMVNIREVTPKFN
jgi:hypothetical protein